MLSLHTNAASLSAQNSLTRTQTSLSTSMTRLSTGYRINSAMDDAAGLQIASRLKSQTSGMAVAMRNTQNSISLLQTADGALNEVNGILMRMKDLATQSVDSSSSDADRDALQSEYDKLTDELSNIVSTTTFGGTTLLNTAATGGGLLGSASGLAFQTGESSAETVHADFSAQLQDIDTALRNVAWSHVATLDANGETQVSIITRFAGDGSPTDPTPGHAVGNAVFPATIRVPDGNGGTMLVQGTWTIMANSSWAMQNLTDAIDAVSALRSGLGAVANRLDHAYNNLANMASNTQAAAGRIMDVDFATESAAMTSNQMLMQSGAAMLKQTNSMASMVMSLLQ
ncbi:flagellin [Telluria mixta]|uniref:Flagellin n=1 Tax=Telluria mixta TaxID=34071 RepID=A0ABT2C5G2_9BURK|nr:flagellin [Telluria mixta]MCS0632619.1 flagellin [Telluria mixta]WEM99088.1 flagellin [Telluria mixta]